MKMQLFNITYTLPGSRELMMSYPAMNEEAAIEMLKQDESPNNVFVIKVEAEDF